MRVKTFNNGSSFSVQIIVDLRGRSNKARLRSANEVRLRDAIVEKCAQDGLSLPKYAQMRFNMGNGVERYFHISEEKYGQTNWQEIFSKAVKTVAQEKGLQCENPEGEPMRISVL